FVGRTVLAPVVQDAGPDQDGVARLQGGLLLAQGPLEVVGGDLVVGGQGGLVPVAGHVDQDPAGDDGRDGGGVALAHPEVAAPLGLGEAVVPVVVLAGGDVAQAVDLGADVV